MGVGFKAFFWVAAAVCLNWVYVKYKEGQSFEIDIDLNLKTTDIVTRHGYPVETHTVVTEDGYVLTLHRIPGSPKASSEGVKTPVFLQHGVACSSEPWVSVGPDRGLGFQLADEGYDVWLGNARGNVYSRSHKTLLPNETQFWNFSFHEMGVYDLPAVIDYILATTNQPQLFYVGHSMGSTMFFVLTSTRPEYNDKIRMMVAMAPAVYVGPNTYFRTLFFKLALFGEDEEIWSRSGQSYSSRMAFCRSGPIFQTICRYVLYVGFGFNWDEMDPAQLHLYLHNVHAGMSEKTYYHCIQLLQTELFQPFHQDGEVTSSIASLPEYDLSRVTLPVSILYGEEDRIVERSGVLRLSKSLPNVINTSPLDDKAAGHLDFLFSNKIKPLINDVVLDLIKRSSVESTPPVIQ